MSIVTKQLPISATAELLFPVVANSDKSSAVAERGVGGHNRHGPKRRGCCATFAGEQLGPRVTQCGLGRGLLPYQVASSSIQPFGHNRHGPKTGGWKLGGGCAPLAEWKMGLHLTHCGQGWGPCMPSFILIHPTVWPHYTNVTDRQDRQRSDSIGRSPLQTVAPKMYTKIPNTRYFDKSCKTVNRLVAKIAAIVF